ncbi:tRNA (adenosine(37)-N6)-dimethylallyltransferase MiaA [Paenibacillus sp. N1-5-1-14]|uniref:tRNA (adenosine(37)-N6)-dimethylallyltransferase MiaA n=1 Tax=Paenibacillus radicibacter TaxID=2972488 RepID=UPI002158C9F9|nr:tRNA (adenosine(37)-N6)-dimethylallyltransferase MiaA [Paenibacillus radicibacter]MCR8641620.1 tRNA (adenosine(37)-N6)-dimethylallyltransferase MiaA [Paenibacillus radicibacter]
MLTNEKAKPLLLVLVGPTAVGKTNLSLTLAEQHQCEIISGDSMQVYRGMDIGTAKASMEERARITHHMIDTHHPDDPFSVAEFQERVRTLIPEIHSRGKLPFIVGGTGLYVESVCYNYQFSEANSDEDLRQQLDAFAILHGDQALHDQLREVDPASAERLHPNDRRRIIRAIEVFRVTGTKLSEQLANQTKESPYNLCIVGLTMDRALLYKRIEERIDIMIEQGLVDEVKRLIDEGCNPDSVAMKGLGYKEIIGYLRGEYSYEGAVELLKRDTRRFAKRQLSWFRHMKDIQWVDVTETTNFSAHLANINDIITGKFVQ